MICKNIKLWEAGDYQGADTGFLPSVDTYLLDGGRVRGAVVVCPGGGYEFTSEREADCIATQFTAAGFHAFVLWYSVKPNRHPQPLRDAARAVALIREHAAEWKVDPQKIAIMGFSAGGHLATSLSVHWNKPWLDISGETCKPNALIACYPVITSGPFAHRGSFAALIGEDPALNELMSLEKHVGGHVPHTFLWHTFSDSAVPVENTLFFADALRKSKVPFELHIYPYGDHGLSLANEEVCAPEQCDPHVATWMPLCIEWLKTEFK